VVSDDGGPRCTLLAFRDPVEAARAAQLVYVHDSMPGIRRHRSDAGFVYVLPGGGVVERPDHLARIHALAIPPAWTDVWICVTPRGHLQATGRDARVRKQYRYHEHFRRLRDETKFCRMIDFGRALPGLRAVVAHDLARHGMPREKVVATCVRLLDASFIRVGNVEYARENESFGLTTLRTDQVRVAAGHVRLRFRGKAGKEHDIDVGEPRLAAIVRRLQELPGQTLFHYLDHAGHPRTVGSADVNAYLREATGHDFTAKDFRTWAGTVIAARELADRSPPPSPAAAKRGLNEAVRAVSEKLGNTPAVSRRFYVHPAVVDGYLTGDLAHVCPDDASCERGLLGLLERRARAVLFGRAGGHEPGGRAGLDLREVTPGSGRRGQRGAGWANPG